MTPVASPALLLFLAFAAGLVLAAAGLILAARGTAAAQAARPPRPEPLISAPQPETLSELRRQLIQAGFGHPAAPQVFVLAKLAAALAGAALAALAVALLPLLSGLAAPLRLALVFLGFLVGYLVPTLVVDRRRAAYRRRIELGLPDALDLMLICVEAGQSLDQSVQRTARELAPIHPDLALAFARATEALAAGADREQAFLRMAQDTDNEDLRSFAALVVQSATLGTPVAQTLRVYAADLRDRRIRRIEERANVLPTKMTLGTMIFTVPPLLILLITPAVIRILDSFK
ncbi:type II secretion system F family protein [Frigidibacter oleivorans]|uniref:type II secretion system F family protein n=1 Tax=Frigidibacter oleivorans TaxID=2487129 RepID=UPI000F8D734A|nr:type II secretion system F family protein [Frigidibacter oleivorans]